MSNILIQDIIKSKFKDDSLPTIAYGNCGGVYDENIDDDLDAVGVGDDNNIYIASCYELLESMLQNDSFLVYSVTGLPNIKVLIDALKFLSTIGEGVEETAKVYVKDYKGCVLPVKEIIDARDSNRVVFVTEARCING